MNNESRQRAPRYRRPSSWDSHRGQAVAIGLSGRLPSPKALALAAAQQRLALPPGLWHISDHCARELANNRGVKLLAAKHSSGAPFLLMVAPDGRVLGVSAETDAGLKLVDLSDPSAWASRQTWTFQPLAETVTT
jgi:hypothetical protein